MMDLVGLDLTTLAYDLPLCEPQPDPFTDTVPRKEERIRAVAMDWIAERHGLRPDGSDCFTWEHDRHYVPMDVLQHAFSFSEIVRIWAAQSVCSEISTWIEKSHPVLEKARHSAWHFGCLRAEYNAIAATMCGLRALSWPGFDVRLAYVSKYRADGWAENVKGNLWIDNDFGLLVHRDGKHVLTVGFGVGAEGVFVSQVQLREKRGNRWLYKLDRHYIDAALDVLARAFGDRLWLVEGKSAAAAVRRSYGKGPCGVTPETEARIAALYDRELDAYQRVGEAVQHEGRRYVRLQRKEAASIAA